MTEVNYKERLEMKKQELEEACYDVKKLQQQLCEAIISNHRMTEYASNLKKKNDELELKCVAEQMKVKQAQSIIDKNISGEHQHIRILDDVKNLFHAIEGNTHKNFVLSRIIELRSKYECLR